MEDVADPRDASGCLLSISSRKASTEPKPLCPVCGEGGGVFTDMSVSPRPLARKVPGRLRAARIHSKDLHASPNGLTCRYDSFDGTHQGTEKKTHPSLMLALSKPTAFVAWLAATPSGFPVTAGSSLLSGNAYRS